MTSNIKSISSNLENIVCFNNGENPEFAMGITKSTNLFKISFNNGTTTNIFTVDNVGNIGIQPLDTKEYNHSIQKN